MKRAKQAWRDRYALSLGLQPTERDQATGEVQVVTCRFCVAFGREPRAPRAPDAAGKRTRARTTNVAKWVPPLRPDNIQMHHVAQHTLKWRAYNELLLQLNQPKDGADVDTVKQQLQMFFDHETPKPPEPKRRRGQQVQEVEVAATEVYVAAAEAEVAEPLDTQELATGTPALAVACNCSQPATGLKPLLLEEILTPEIVETLVDGLYADDGGGLGTEWMDSAMMKQVLAGGQQSSQRRQRGLSAGGRRTEKFVISVTNRQQLADVQRLLGIGLTFEQVALCLATSSLSVATVRRYARLSVAASLQMISSIMRRTWAYSIAFQVFRCPKDSSRGGGRSKAALELCVRLPMPRGADVADLHLMALPLPSFEHSPEQVTTFIERVLDTLDVEWKGKLLGGSVNGAANEMGAHVSLLDDILQQSTSSCSYRVWRPAQTTAACLRSVLQDLNGGRYQRSPTVNAIQEKESFMQELVTLATFLRGYEPWVRNYGRCPQLDTTCPWSSLKVLEWVVTRRHNILVILQEQPYIQLPPSSFWLVSSVLIDVLSGFKETVSNLERFPLPSSIDSERTLACCVSATANKCKISRSEGIDTATQHEMLLEEDKFHLGSFCWPRKAALIPYLRSLNLSMRRLYDGLPSGDKNGVEWILARFVLDILRSVVGIRSPSLFEASSPLATSKTILYDPPPTLPLDFVAIERLAAVDLVERYSERLEQAHDLVFLDNISEDIQVLKTITSDNPSLRMELERAQLTSFRSAWGCVPDLVPLRTFAAGLATVLPRTVGGPLHDVVLSTESTMAVATALQEREGDQYRANVGDFAVEVRLHMNQARVVESIYQGSEVG